MTDVKKGTTNYSTVVRIIDSGDGTPETGITSTTAGLAVRYHRDLSAAVTLTSTTAIALSTLSSATSAHTDGGFLHLGDGYCRVDFPDATYATGSDQVFLGGTATGMIMIGREIPLVNFDPNDPVRLGLTALPNATSTAAGGIILKSDVTTDAALVDLIYDENKSGHTTADTYGKLIQDVETTTDQFVFTTANEVDASLSATGLDLIASTATGMIEIAKAIWDRVISMANHNIGQSAGKILRQSGDIAQIDGAVSDASPAVGGFDTNLTDVDTYWEDAVLVFSNGAANAGLGKPISTFLNTNGAMTFATPDDWPVVPVNGDDFTIYANHVHPIAQIATGVNATQLIESYAADGVAPTLTQAVMLIQQQLGDFSISGTTLTVKKVDGSSTAATFTLDDSANPTSITRTT